MKRIFFGEDVFSLIHGLSFVIKSKLKEGILALVAGINLKKFLKIILTGVTICLDIDVLLWIGEIVLRFYISATLEIIPPAQVLYMRRTGEYGIENRALMDRFKKWVEENHLYREDTAIYAIPMDDPQKVEACQCRYDVCIHRPKNQAYTQNQIRCRELEGGRYLVFRIPHTAKAVCTAWKMCFSALEEWGYCLDTSRHIMERYQKGMVENHCCELCVPIL